MDSLQQIINSHLPQLILGVFFSILALSIAWQKDFFHLPQATPAPKLSSKAFFGCLFVFLIVLAFIAPLISTLWLSIEAGHFVNPSKIELSTFSQIILNILAIIVTAISMIVYYSLCSPQTRHAVWRTSPHQKTGHDIIMGIVTWLICFPLVIIVSQVIEILGEWLFHFTRQDQLAVYFLKLTREFPLLFALMAFLIAFVVPMVEELIFRGFIQTWLLGWFHRTGAIIFTSIIFAFCHYSASQGLDNIELLTSLFVFSCFLGFIYERQQSLWASIALHSTFNIVSIFAILVE